MTEPTFSTSLSLVKTLLGPHARIWKRSPGFVVGLELNGRKEILSEGATLTEAVRGAFPETFKKLDGRLASIRETMANAEKAIRQDVEKSLERP